MSDAFKDIEYRGNKNLKEGEVVVKVSLTEKEYFDNEIEKCVNDILYFAKNYFHIISLGKGKHIIETYKKQEELLKFMEANDRVVCLASRQVGKCVDPETLITVRNKNTLQEETITILDFYNKHV